MLNKAVSRLVLVTQQCLLSIRCICPHRASRDHPVNKGPLGFLESLQIWTIPLKKGGGLIIDVLPPPARWSGAVSRDKIASTLCSIQSALLTSKKNGGEFPPPHAFKPFYIYVFIIMFYNFFNGRYRGFPRLSLPYRYHMIVNTKIYLLSSVNPQKKRQY